MLTASALLLTLVAPFQFFTFNSQEFIDLFRSRLNSFYGNYRYTSLYLVTTPTPAFSIKPTSVPTLTPSFTITMAPSPTVTATPVPTRIVTPLPTGTPTPIPTTNQQSYLMQEINNYRQSKGLSLVKTDPYTCGFAATRAKEISTSFNHDGFRQRIENKTLPYPSYRYVTENLARTGDYRNVVKMWVNSPGHAANIEKDTPFVCVESNGDYYAYEGWKP